VCDEREIDAFSKRLFSAADEAKTTSGRGRGAHRAAVQSSSSSMPSLLPRAVGRVALPAWYPCAVGGAVVALLAMVAVFLPPQPKPRVTVAMIGNSMQYYNDFPRFLGTCCAPLTEGRKATSPSPSVDDAGLSLILTSHSFSSITM
jgi:hypothetical protein